MNARYFILTDQDNTYGIVFMENGIFQQLHQKIKSLLIEWFGELSKIIWTDDFTFTCFLNDEESREYYLTETELY